MAEGTPVRDLTWLSAAPGVRTRGEAAASVWLAALSLAGAVLMASVPAAALRGYPLTSLVTLLALAFGAVGAEAMWNARAWRYRALLVSSILATGPGLIQAVDAWLTGAAVPFPITIRAVRWVLLMSMAGIGLLWSRAALPRGTPPSAHRR